MGDFERTIKQVYEAWRLAKGATEKQEHPADEIFACFIDGLLTIAEERGIREHILTCAACASRLKAHLVTQSPAEDPPPELLEKVRTILKQECGACGLELVVRAKESFLEIVNTTADVLVGQECVPAVVFRSRMHHDFKDSLTVLKDCHDIRIELTVEKKDKDFAVTTVLKDRKTQKECSGVRVTLMKDGAELESYRVKVGKAVFAHVQAGKYSIELTPRDGVSTVLFLEIAV